MTQLRVEMEMTPGLTDTFRDELFQRLSTLKNEGVLETVFALAPISDGEIRVAAAYALMAVTADLNYLDACKVVASIIKLPHLTKPCHIEDVTGGKWRSGVKV